MKSQDAAGAVGAIIFLLFALVVVAVKGTPYVYKAMIKITRFLSTTLNRVTGLYPPGSLSTTGPAAVLGSAGWVLASLAFGIALLIIGAPAEMLAILVPGGAAAGACFGALSVNEYKREARQAQTLEDIFPPYYR